MYCDWSKKEREREKIKGKFVESVLKFSLLFERGNVFRSVVISSLCLKRTTRYTRKREKGRGRI